MDGVGISIIGRPRPLPGHDTPNPAHNTYTLKCEEPFWRSVPSDYQGYEVPIMGKDSVLMHLLALGAF